MQQNKLDFLKELSELLEKYKVELCLEYWQSEASVYINDNSEVQNLFSEDNLLFQTAEYKIIDSNMINKFINSKKI